MEQLNLEQIQAWMDAEASPQMLFRDRKLCLLNRALRQIWPGAETGADLEAVFGPEVSALEEFSGEGSLVFSAKLAGTVRDFQVILWQDFYRVTVLDKAGDGVFSAMEAISRSMMAPMSGVMAVTPKLLHYCTEREEEKPMKWAAQLNQGVYALMRTAGHLRACSGSMSISVAPSPRNLSIWLRELYGELEPLMAAAERTLTLKLPERDYMCRIDQEKFKQALLNLLSNAIKFTQKGGSIVLQLKPSGTRRLCLSLRDDGCGISPGRMGTIFSMGGHGALIPDPRQGAGLGLPMARAIVQAHGGSLLLESQEGKGTTVYLYLDRDGQPRDLNLRSDVKYPRPLGGGFSATLVELADALPYRVYDTRDVDG